MPFYKVRLKGADGQTALVEVPAREIRLAQWPQLDFLTHKEIAGPEGPTLGRRYIISEFTTGTRLTNGTNGVHEAVRQAMAILAQNRSHVGRSIESQLRLYGYANEPTALPQEGRVEDRDDVLSSLDAAIVYLHEYGLAVSRETIRTDLKKGARFGKRDGRHWRINRESLLQYYRGPRKPRGGGRSRLSLKNAKASWASTIMKCATGQVGIIIRR